MKLRTFVWIPIVGDVFIINTIRSINDVFKYFDNWAEVVFYTIYQTSMWTLFAVGLYYLIY